MHLEEKISIVMPVYNTSALFLADAVDSMLNQSFRDFEFIIVDDGSNADIKEYLESLNDPRILIIRNEANLGITKSLNKGFKAAKGKYIARMDADDISLLYRLEKQFSFMEDHPDVIVCGAMTGAIGTEPQDLSGEVKVEDMEEYRIRMLFTNPGPYHPTAFFRHDPLITHNILYDEKLYYAQDYGMWEKISHYGNVCVLKDVLLLRRKHENQITKMHRSLQIECDKMTQRKLLSELMGDVSDEEMDLHYIHSSGGYRDAKITPQIHKWYGRILKANKQNSLYNQHKLKRYIVRIERRLVEQTFTVEMSNAKKAMLYFRYLPFFDAAKATARVAVIKVRGLMNN